VLTKPLQERSSLETNRWVSIVMVCACMELGKKVIRNLSDSEFVLCVSHLTEQDIISYRQHGRRCVHSVSRTEYVAC